MTIWAECGGDNTDAPIMMIPSLRGRDAVAKNAACCGECSRDMNALPIEVNCDRCQSPAQELASIAGMIRELCRILP